MIYLFGSIAMVLYGWILFQCLLLVTSLGQKKQNRYIRSLPLFHLIGFCWLFVTRCHLDELLSLWPFLYFFWFFGRCFFLFNLPSLRSYKIHLQPPFAFREPQLCRTRGRSEAILQNPDPCTYWGWPCQMHVDLVAYGCRVVMKQDGQNSTSPLQQCKFTPESLDSPV